MAESESPEELPTDSEGEGGPGGEVAAEERRARVAGASGKMSKSRATGLAKVNMVIEWLASALGGAASQARCAHACCLSRFCVKPSKFLYHPLKS